MTEPDALAVLAAYLDFKARTALNPHTGNPIQAKTLKNHLQVAAACLRLSTSLPISIISYKLKSPTKKKLPITCLLLIVIAERYMQSETTQMLHMRSIVLHVEDNIALRTALP